jgi:hypothetical protein
MTLAYILANPVYCGRTQFNDQLFQGEHEALIEEGLYHKVQSLASRSWPSGYQDPTDVSSQGIAQMQCLPVVYDPALHAEAPQGSVN